MGFKFILTFVLMFSSLTFLSGCVALEVADEERSQFKTPAALYDRALFYYDHGQYEKAKIFFHQYIAQYPDSLLFKVALYYLGHCYQMSGDEKEATTLYNRVLHRWGEDDTWGEMSLKRLHQIKGEPDGSHQK